MNTVAFWRSLAVIVLITIGARIFLGENVSVYLWMLVIVGLALGDVLEELRAIRR